MPEDKRESPQVEKFRQLARELETDDDETRFDERLKRLATAAREPKPTLDIRVSPIAVHILRKSCCGKALHIAA